VKHGGEGKAGKIYRIYDWIRLCLSDKRERRKYCPEASQLVTIRFNMIETIMH
jgi:hypothetical protein